MPKESYCIGDKSLAFGKNSVAWGNSSLTVGQNVLAKRNCSLAIGKYNDPSSTHVVTVGQGSKNNKYNVASIDEKGAFEIDKVLLRQFSVGEWFEYDGDKPEAGESVGVLDNGKVCRLIGDRECMIPRGVVTPVCSISSHPNSLKHKINEWNDYEYVTKVKYEWRPKMIIEQKNNKKKYIEYINEKWTEVCKTKTNTMRPEMKQQPVYNHEGNVLYHKNLYVMEQVKIEYQERIPISPEPEKDLVQVCVLGNAVVKNKQKTDLRWIFRKKINDQYDQYYIK